VTFERTLQLIGMFGAIATFLWGVYQWDANQRAQRAQLASEAEKLAFQRAEELSKTAMQRKIEAQKPFLDKQLQLYTEAVQVTSFIATTPASPEREKMERRFWQLYWGELGMVEDGGVGSEMVNFGSLLKQGGQGSELQPVALRLAHAARASLDKSWGITVWTDR
jgi:hypothetical protein